MSPPSPSGATFRPLRTEDIPLAMELKELSGWNQTERDWRNFLSLRPGGCFAAICDDRVVGTVTTVDYGGTVSWVGMVLVHPDWRGRGIGTELLGLALESLKACETVKLDATPLGKRVYEPLGFVSEWQLERWVRAHGNKEVPTSSAALSLRKMTTEDLARVGTLDDLIFGSPRPGILAAWFRGAPQYAFLCERQGEMCGYVLGRAGSRYEHIGPLVADDVTVAEALLHSPARTDWQPPRRHRRSPPTLAVATNTGERWVRG